ncbi:MAG: hypothetical protein ABR541_08135 [Candidatus Dormibacteria bacterium]
MSEQGGRDISTQDLASTGEQQGAGQQAVPGDEQGRQPEPLGHAEQQQGQPGRAAEEGAPRQGPEARSEPGGPAGQPAGGGHQPQQFQGQGGGRTDQGGNDSGGLVQDSQGFRNRWTEIQAAFVDEPRKAVEQADGLVAEVIQHLARSFAEERSSLERQWAGGNSVSTEDLRVSLQRYRQFFQTLLRD